MTDFEATKRCANCGKEHPAGQLDDAGWCGDCRRKVIRKATLFARAAGFLGALLAGYWVVTVMRPSARFSLLWAVLLVAIYYLLYTLARRVAFELIRGRGGPRTNGG